MTSQDNYIKQLADYLGQRWEKCNRCGHTFIPQTCKRCGEKDTKFCRKCHILIDTKYRVGFRHGD